MLRPPSRRAGEIQGEDGLPIVDDEGSNFFYTATVQSAAARK